MDAPPGPITVSIAALTDVGCARAVNEDAFFIAALGGSPRRVGPAIERDRLPLEAGLAFGVCDGMGGMSSGDAASRGVVTHLPDALDIAPLPTTEDDLRDRLFESVRAANRWLCGASASDPRMCGTGSTVTAAALVDEVLVVAQVGDSRGYLLRDRKLVPITEDDRLTAEFVRANHPDVTEEQIAALPRNVITKALGMREDLEPRMGRLLLRRGDVILLCTDGLTELVDASTIRAILLRQRDLGAACHQLINAALRAGGHDNITVVVAHFNGEGLVPPIRAERVDPVNPRR